VDGARAVRTRNGRLLRCQRLLRLDAGRCRRGGRAGPGVGPRVLGWLHRRGSVVRSERAHGAEARVQAAPSRCRF
jgi:hypothetical protein